MPNPNYRRTSKSRVHVANRAGFTVPGLEHLDTFQSLLRDTTSPYIKVPCHKCADCIAVDTSEIVQRVTEEAKFNHLFFATLTYDNKHLPKLSLEVPTGAVLDSVDGSYSKLCKLAHNFQSNLREVHTPLSLDDYYNLGLHRTALDFEDLPPDGFVDDLPPDYAVHYEVANKDQLVPSDDNLPDCSDLLEPSCSHFLYENSPVISKLSEDVRKRFNFVQAECLLDGDTSFVDIPFTDVSHLQLLFKRMRDNNDLGRPFRYLAVSERGSDKGRPHVHIIFFIPKHQDDTVATCESLNVVLRKMLLAYWSVNIGSRKMPVYERLFTYRQKFINGKRYSNFDCHYVNPAVDGGVANVAYYVTKYVSKDSDKERALQVLLRGLLTSKEDFNLVWSVVKSRVVCSKGLGFDAEFTKGDGKHRHLVFNSSIVETLKSHALLDKETGSAIYVAFDGKHIPLCSYYRERILDTSDMLELYVCWNPHKYPFAFDNPRTFSSEEIRKKDLDYARRRRLMDSHDEMDSRLNELSVAQIHPSEYRSLSKNYNL